MSNPNEPNNNEPEKVESEERDTSKLDQMIEEFKKKNPGKGSKKTYGAYRS